MAEIMNKLPERYHMKVERLGNDQGHFPSAVLGVSKDRARVNCPHGQEYHGLRGVLAKTVARERFMGR